MASAEVLQTAHVLVKAVNSIEIFEDLAAVCDHHQGSRYPDFRRPLESLFALEEEEETNAVVGVEDGKRPGMRNSRNSGSWKCHNNIDDKDGNDLDS